ncbi:MAG: endopeptidase La [Deltaproteobacteria bacterium]|nr:endopeptidase La [Deltaproteobacteria bacterium]MBN2673689.1 endopeptidase La [Deltaproteobacteria bacterium]
MIEQIVPILPLRNSVMFPASVVPINVGRKKSIAAIEEVQKGEEQLIAVLSQKDADTEDPAWPDLYQMGTIARILKVIRLGDDNYSVVLQGVERFKIIEPVSVAPILRAKVVRIPDNAQHNLELEALANNLKETGRKLINLLPNLPKEASGILEHVTEPGILADLVASNLTVEVAEKQTVIEAVDVEKRIRTCLKLLTKQLEMLKVKKEISSAVQEEMGRSQREYFLRQQMKAIKEELGEGEDVEDEIEEIRAKIADSGMTDEAEKMANKQLNRLRHMQTSSAEYTVTRTYLDWLIELPWKSTTDDKLDIDTVQQILDEDHYDLEKVKKRILEQIAVLKLNPEKKGSILCLVGPPGVGKTSLGKSIARAIGREFVRISLGGVRDEAEIRGHRRTYVGALPGRVIQGMKKAGTVNPLFMLDELDKLGSDFRGDPASAMLEVLDPEQNNTFSDHYLEVTYDLSKVMFIGTANNKSTIPPALLDRIEMIDIPGYTREEKRQIALNYAVPKQIGEHGLTDELLHFPDDGIFRIIDSYTREAGVRNLEREIARVCRAVAVKVARNGADQKYVANDDFIQEVLGPVKFIPEMADRCSVPGVTTGLAWTPMGGDIIFIEATKMKGSGKMAMTGQLGDVMKESAQTALSYVKSNVQNFGLEPNVTEEIDIHLHVPAGSVPKDGPSAGVSMFTSLVSLFTNRNVRSDVAMTGEITLRGLVLPIGGVKEKVLAAHRAGIKCVILPERNRKDKPDIPEEILQDIELIFVSRMEEVIETALEPAQ